MSVPVAPRTTVPLSWGQERLWFLQQLEPRSTAYHVMMAHRLLGPLRVEALEAAITGLTDRHEALRTRFPADGGVPVQAVEAPGPVPLERIDVVDVVDVVDDDDDDDGKSAREQLVRRIETPFDLAAAPPVRWVLARLADDDHVLCLVVHHIAADGWSLGLICGELAELYRAAVTGAPADLPELELQYGDHAARQREGDDGSGDGVAFWRSALAGAPPLDLREARPRPEVRGWRAATRREQLPAPLCEAVQHLARTHRVTLFMTMLAAWSVVLARHSGAADFCVGTPVSVRDDERVEPLVGFFVNTLALRGDLAGDPTFADLLARTRRTALAAYDHAQVPFERLVGELGVDRDPGRTPVFQTMLQLQPGGDVQLRLTGVEWARFDLGYRAAQVDLALEVTWAPEGAAAELVYAEELFTPETVAAIADDLVAVLTRAAGAPDARLSSLGLLPPLDRAERSAVPEPEPTPPAPSAPPARSTPDGPVETALAQIWADALGVAAVGPEDDFFDLGGHSLLAVRVVARQRTALPDDARPLTVMDLFRHRTVRRLARVATGEDPSSASGGLLHELTPPVASGRRTVSLVCVPYGGGSAVVYQPLADALGTDCSLFSVAIPGHDPGAPAESLPLEEVARRCVAEIQERIDGPVVLYGHCGVGGALTVEMALQLRDAGRTPQAVYLAATYPFTQPPGRALGLLSRLAGKEAWRSDRVTSNWLTSMGADLEGFDDEQVAFVVRGIRHDGEAAEAYYGTRMAQHVEPLDCPVVSVVGEEDPVTDYASERFREWHFLSERTALVVLPSAGHFFLKYRADELAEIVTGTHPALAAGTVQPEPEPAGPVGAGPRRWWVAGVSTRPAGTPAGDRADPPIRGFLAVALGQLVSIAGSAVTDFALPLWVYLQVHSLAHYALLSLLAVMPGVVVAPLAGAVVDRADRKRVMLGGDLAAGLAVGAVAVLHALGSLHLGFVYVLVALLSIALTFQRLAYASAVPQLVPKRYLGHANGIVEMSAGIAQFLSPLIAVGLLAAVGLGGVLVIDLVSFAVAVTVVALVRFPALLPYRRRETLAEELLGGVRYSLQRPHFRSMLAYFATCTVFLSALLLAVSPLVLARSGLSAVGTVAVVGGAGAALGGLTMVLWGGPRRRRMRGVLVWTAIQGGFALLTGLRPSLVLVSIGAAGTLYCLALIRGTFATIVHVKVPQRLQGRVFAVNQMISWSTIPLGFAVLTPLWAHVFTPLLTPGGALAGSVGAVIGTGPGRGIGFMYVVFGLALTALSLVPLRWGRLARFDDQVPDTVADDLVGLQEHRKGTTADAR